MLGDRVVELAVFAERRAIIIAPFIKQEALAKLLSHVRREVEVVCVTRWRVNEIAGGASDLEVWPLIRNRSGKLLLRNDLHAKVYVFDDRCLVGSANLTNGGFGWGTMTNLELLIEVPRHAPEVLSLETAIEGQSIDVDDDLFNTFVRAVAGVEAPQLELSGSAPDLPAAWLPSLRSPEFLYDVYSGNAAHLPRAAIETATEDLRTLKIAEGLSRSQFEGAVSMKLIQTPIMAGLDRMLMTPRRFGEITSYLDRQCGYTERESSSAWQTLMRWMRHFMPLRYSLSVPNYSEVMVRSDALRRMLGNEEEA